MKKWKIIMLLYIIGGVVFWWIVIHFLIKYW